MDAEVKENKQEVKDPFGQALTQRDAMANELLLTKDFNNARMTNEAIHQKMSSDQRKEKKIMKSLATRAYDIRLLEEQKTGELIKLLSQCQLEEKFVSELIVQGYRHHLSQGHLDEALNYWQQHHKVLGQMNTE